MWSFGSKGVKSGKNSLKLAVLSREWKITKESVMGGEVKFTGEIGG